MWAPAPVARIAAAYPAVDVLVNNMGNSELKPLVEEISNADWLCFFEANVLIGVPLGLHYVGGCSPMSAATATTGAALRVDGTSCGRSPDWQAQAS